MAKRVRNLPTDEEIRAQAEAIFLSGHSMFGPMHFIDHHLNGKWVANFPGIQEPKAFSTKRRAIAEVKAVVYRISHKDI